MTRLLYALCISALLTATAAAQTPRPKDSLETLGILNRAIVAAAEELVITQDDADVSLKIALPDGTEFVIYPDNLHINLQNAGSSDARDAVLAGHVAGLLDTFGTLSEPSETALDLDRVMPVVRPAEILWAADANKLPHDTFPGDLVVYWVIDSDTQTMSVNTDELRNSGLSQEAIAERALQNLQARSEDVKLQSVGVATALLLDGYYESSLLLLPTFWTEIDAQIGTVVVAVPTRDFVVYIDGDDPEIVAGLRDIARSQFAAGAYGVSPDLFRWDTDHWVLLP